MNLTKYMDFVLCVEDYSRSKPHPEPYLAGMKLFGAKKSECLVVEDSERGLNAAFNADIECAVVANEFTATHDFSKASYRLKNLKELVVLLDTLSLK
ncbi:MAG: HAD-IA family hydrolase [Sulfurimonas sp.]|nr:HAD-IA family hydrolase [Sulfurimonas sp.]